MLKRWFGFILLPIALMSLVACGRANLFEGLVPSHEPQAECGFVQNVYQERISWKNQLPIRLTIHESVPKEMYEAFDRAIKDWEQAYGKPLFQIVDWNAPGPVEPRQDRVSMIYWMNTWEDNRSSEQARTSIYWLGNEITEADIRINARDFAFYVNTPQNTKDVHLESLLVHELGHVLGLKHKDLGASVMATYLAASTSRTAISQTDLESLRCEY